MTSPTVLAIINSKESVERVSKLFSSSRVSIHLSSPKTYMDDIDKYNPSLVVITSDDMDVSGMEDIIKDAGLPVLIACDDMLCLNGLKVDLDLAGNNTRVFLEMSWERSLEKSVALCREGAVDLIRALTGGFDMRAGDCVAASNHISRKMRETCDALC